jgi:N-acetyl-anhydromuramyl-L-alanine amidase AmpD
MNIDKTTYQLPATQYYQEEHHKNLIVLHFTSGSTASGAYQDWVTTPVRVGTSFLVDRSGVVYETFDPRYWAYHLGIASKAGSSHDQRSIGIEIVNFGPLKLVGNTLYSWPNNYRNRFCDLSETNRYVRKAYRGFEYYAAFTEEQKQVVPELVKHISTTFNIPRTLPPADKREVSDLGFSTKWNGIATHQMFRSDKFDIGPAWDWGWLE